MLKQFEAPVYGGIESFQRFLGQLRKDNSMTSVYFKKKDFFESSNEMILSKNRD